MAIVTPKFVVGERVLCFEPDQSKARVLYDAKVIDVDVIKEGKVRKETEYKIHFQGWNSAWDRWANESYVLRNTEENKKLQRKLARRAIKQLKNHGRKKVYLPGVAASIKNCPSSSDSDGSSDDILPSILLDVTDQYDAAAPPDKRRKKKSTGNFPKSNDDACNDVAEVADMVMQRKSNVFEFPDVLRQRIHEDSKMITKRGMVVKLPSHLNVVQILENYVKYFGFYVAKLSSSEKRMKSCSQFGDMIPPEKSLNLCMETCEDLRILFDFVLPILLLYSNEEQQLARLSNIVLRNEEREEQHSIISGGVDATQHSDELSLGFEENLPEYMSMHVRRNDVDVKPTPMQTHHRKTAEEQVIEETHTYLISHQPNLDRTGLANDAQGRRRSNRLSQHLCSLDRNLSSTESPISLDLEDRNHESSHQSVSMETKVFLRPPTNHVHGSKCERSYSSFPLLFQETDRFSCFSPSITFNQMCQEIYIGSAGEDMKKTLHLQQAWKFRLFPPTFSPAASSVVPYSLVYGIQHLLRLFVKLPDILSKMDIPEHRLKIVYKHVHLILKFVADYDREIASGSGTYIHVTS